MCQELKMSSLLAGRRMHAQRWLPYAAKAVWSCIVVMQSGFCILIIRTGHEPHRFSNKVPYTPCYGLG